MSDSTASEYLPLLSDSQRIFWDVNGYLVLPRFFDNTRTRQINALIDRIWRERKTLNHKLVIDTYLDTPQQQRLRLRNAKDIDRQHPYKLNDVFLSYAEVREVVLDEALSQIIGELLVGEPMISNSLNLERGSQQGMHVDTFFMPPRIEGKMLATWISLEDIHPESGPLFFYPGSHLIPQYHFSNGSVRVIPAELPHFYAYMDQEIQKRSLKREVFCGGEGDVFIWHAHLLHGGMPIVDRSLTRKSLVTHYFRSCDVSRSEVRTIAPGRHYLNRSHQWVDIETKLELQMLKRGVKGLVSKLLGALGKK